MSWAWTSLRDWGLMVSNTEPAGERIWTDEQVRNINEFQRSGAMHPFTCSCPHPERNYRLIAHPDGLRCDHCGHHQTWVHPFMADGAAVRSHNEMMARLFGSDRA